MFSNLPIYIQWKTLQHWGNQVFCGLLCDLWQGQNNLPKHINPLIFFMQKVFLESLHVHMGVSKARVTHLPQKESLQRPAQSITLWYHLSAYALVHRFIQIVFITLFYLFYLCIYTYLQLLFCEENTWVISIVNIIHVFELFLSLKHLYFSFYSRQGILFNLWLIQNGIMREYMHFLFVLLQTNKQTNKKSGLYSALSYIF